jgi:hypothetical protein
VQWLCVSGCSLARHEMKRGYDIRYFRPLVALYTRGAASVGLRSSKYTVCCRCLRSKTSVAPLQTLALLGTSDRQTAVCSARARARNAHNQDKAITSKLYLDACRVSIADNVIASARVKIPDLSVRKHGCVRMSTTRFSFVVMESVLGWFCRPSQRPACVGLA